MRLGNFGVLVPQGTEHGDGKVALAHGRPTHAIPKIASPKPWWPDFNQTPEPEKNPCNDAIFAAKPSFV